MDEWRHSDNLGEYILPEGRPPSFNVFICHTEKDGAGLVDICKGVCAKLLELPEYKGRVSIVPWDWCDVSLEYGKDYQAQIDSAKLMSCQIVIAAMRFVLSDGVRTEIERVAKAKGRRPALFVLAPEPDVIPREKTKPYDQLVAYLKETHDKPQLYCASPLSELEKGFARAVEDCLRKHISWVMKELDDTARLADEDSPAGAADLSERVPYFPGLAPWPTAEYESFGGRDDEIEPLVHRLRIGRVLHLKGASGAGKSSLVYAGILPRLGAGIVGHVAFKPGLDPFVAAVNAINERLPTIRQKPQRARESAAARMAADYGHFKSALDDVLPLQNDRFRVLFVDQLEELLISSPGEADELKQRRGRFSEYLIQYIQEDQRNLLVTTGRADVDEMLSQTHWRPLGTLINSHDFRIYPPILSPEHLERMIGKSASRAGFSVSADLIDALHRDLYDWRGDDWPPIFGIILEEMVTEWKRQPRERALNAALYESVGRLAGVIRRLTVDATDDPKSLDAVFPLLVRLDNSGKVTKRRILWTRVGDAERALLVDLKAKRLVRDEGGLELSHDILFREWPSLKEWIDRRRDDLDELSDLEHRSQLWERRKFKRSELLPAEKLEFAAEVLERNPARDKEEPLMRKHLDASRQYRDQEALVRAIQEFDSIDLRRLLAAKVELAPDMVGALAYPQMYYAMFPERIPNSLRPRAADATKTAFGERSGTAIDSRLDYFDQLDSGATANKGYKVQHFAALAGQVAVLARLHSCGFDMAITGGVGVSSFDLAAYGGSLEAVEWIWNAFPAPERASLLIGRSKEKMTALHWAADQGHLAIVEWLIAAGADVGAADTHGATALYWAASKGHTAVVRHLLTATSSDVNASLTGQWSGWTALHAAAENGHLETVASLLADTRVEPNAAGSDGGTPLHEAVDSSRAAVVGILLGDQRVDPNVRDKSGQTPLHLLLSTQRFRQMDADPTILNRLLEDRRVDVNAQNGEGMTPLHLAAAADNLLAIERLIADPRVNRELLDGDGSTPLGRASDPVVVAKLVAAGVALPLWSSLAADVTGESRLARLEGDALVSRIEGDLQSTTADEWPLPPLIAGEWERLPASRAARVLASLAPTLPSTFGYSFTSIDAVRRVTLPFYKGAHLLEARVRRGSEVAGSLTFIEHENGFTWLTGTSAPIHDLNASIPIALTRNTVLDYLRFFCRAVHGDQGAFTIFEHGEDLLPLPSAPPDEVAGAETLARPCTIVSEPGESGSSSDILVDAVVKYSNAIFSARFSVQVKEKESPTKGTSTPGMIEMLDDNPLAANLNVLVEVFKGGIRTSRPQSAAAKALFPPPQPLHTTGTNAATT